MLTESLLFGRTNFWSNFPQPDCCCCLFSSLTPDEISSACNLWHQHKSNHNRRWRIQGLHSGQKQNCVWLLTSLPRRESQFSLASNHWFGAKKVTAIWSKNIHHSCLQRLPKRCNLPSFQQPLIHASITVVLKYFASQRKAFKGQPSSSKGSGLSTEEQTMGVPLLQLGCDEKSTTQQRPQYAGTSPSDKIMFCSFLSSFESSYSAAAILNCVPHMETNNQRETQRRENSVHSSGTTKNWGVHRACTSVAAAAMATTSREQGRATVWMGMWVN